MRGCRRCRGSYRRPSRARAASGREYDRRRGCHSQHGYRNKQRRQRPGTRCGRRHCSVRSTDLIAAVQADGSRLGVRMATPVAGSHLGPPEAAPRGPERTVCGTRAGRRGQPGFHGSVAPRHRDVKGQDDHAGTGVTPPPPAPRSAPRAERRPRRRPVAVRALFRSRRHRCSRWR